MPNPLPGWALCLALAWPLAAAAGEITVFAAASLKGALDTAAAQWRQATGQGVTLAYGGTPQLALQIAQGAPADVFLSASVEWMDRLQAEGLIDAATRRDLFGNRLVLVTAEPDLPQVDLAGPVDLAGLLAGQNLSMALVDSVPAGQYGRAALESLGQWPAVAPLVVQSENVRLALELVARGEARLGVVYASDARAEPRVRVLGVFPAASHPTIRFPAAVVAGAAAPTEARAFLDFLGQEGAAAFLAQGFTRAVP